MGIPCIVKHYDVRAEAKARGLGEEETGRLLRYAAFRQTAGEDGFIAVAHHRRDQAETVLMRLCRGTGLKGLAGMAPVRENICRPLLFCDREEIEDYCRENRLEWREDATNREEAYTRNKLRLRVLPILEEINPQAVAHIAKTASLLAEEEDFLEQQTALYWKEVQLPSLPEEVSLSIEGLNALHPAMRRRILRQAVGQFQKKDISAKQLVAKAPVMSYAVSEYVFLQADSEQDAAQAVKILQTRIDSQADGDAFYPETIDQWKAAKVLQNGAYVAMIASGEHQTEIEDAWNAQFGA